MNDSLDSSRSEDVASDVRELTRVGISAEEVVQRGTHICCVGASAGGLEAIQQFFAALPGDLGVAYVVIQHLAPDHQSRMTELLSRVTHMPVLMAQDSDIGMRVDANKIYLIPPARQMVIQNSRLFLSERERGEQLTLPIDHFLFSLAQDQGRYSIAAILSGTGGDGASGIEDVHHSGGMVLAQDPRTARYDSMPERAIATGLVDVILPPAGMAEAITHYVRQSLAREQVDQLELSSGEPVPNTILELLGSQAKIDFSNYKPTSLVRKIERRRELSGAASLLDYQRQLSTDRAEREKLLGDLLIGVTSFFRDAEAFELLQHEVLSKILAGKKAGDEIRVWCAGCATGEEAYSLAFLINEAIARSGKTLQLKLFASDIHAPAIDHALAGVYPADAMRTLPNHLREKYFVQVKGGYQVVAAIRRQMVFVRHNLTKDAPFTRMDMVACRNLLIYLQPHAQNKCLSLFHFALRAGGFLFLGSNESVGELDDEFNTINWKWRLFRKLRDVQLASNRAEARHQDARPRTPPIQPSPLRSARLPDQRLQQAYDMLLSRVLPAGFLIDADLGLLHTFGNAGDFLQIQAGRHTNVLTDLVHPAIRKNLTIAIQHCLRDRCPVEYSGVQLSQSLGNHEQILSIKVDPLVVDEGGVVAQLLVMFQETTQTAAVQISDVPPAKVDLLSSRTNSNEQLERELLFTRENLQATIQELESNNEELQATNEEMVSSNEELQSTNEELQSVNEELHTVNAEYHRKITELQELNDDIDNLLRSSEVAVLFLDDSLAIRRFTPMLARLSSFRSSDVGRPITSFQSKLVNDNVIQAIKRVLATRDPEQGELEYSNDRILLYRITPFESRTLADGVVINYTDATLVREKEESAKRWASIVESTADCIVAMDLSGTVIQWNHSATQLYKYSDQEAIGKNFYDLVVPQEHLAEMQLQVEQVRANRHSSHFATTRKTKFGQLIEVSVRLSPVLGGQEIVGISSIERDITDLKRRATLDEFEGLARTGSSPMRSAAEQWQSLTEFAVARLRAYCIWGWQVDVLTNGLAESFASNNQLRRIWLSENQLDLAALAKRAHETGKRVQRSVREPPKRLHGNPDRHVADCQTGQGLGWRLLLQPLMQDGVSYGVIGILLFCESQQALREIQTTLAAIAKELASQTENRNRMQELVRISDIVENATDFIGTADAKGNIVFVNRAGRLLTGIGLDEDTRELSLRDLHPSESLETIFSIGVPEATRAGHWTGETELIDRKGHRIPVSQLITSHRDENGQLRYLSTICRVIAEQKGVQSRLEELIRETNSANQAKTTFLANISHDVRTPMTSVIGLTELLLEETQDSEHLEMLKTIRDNGRYVTTLLNDLLDLSKVESGKLTISPTNTDLRELLSDIVASMRPNIEGGKVELIVDLGGAPTAPIFLDAVRVRQVVENLMSNSGKFTAKGFIELCTRSQDGMLEIAVTDSGCGIEHSLLASVFDPYSQSMPTSRRRTRGAGLGLAVSRKLAELMGGELTAESTSGTGSRFALRIPLVPAVEDDDDVEESKIVFPSELRPLRGKRLLIAEDTRAIQFLVQRTLVSQGMEVQVVENGQDALKQLELAAIEGNPFDALILDMQMPILDGYQTARAIRQQGMRLPVIAMTASTMHEELQASLDAGCDGFIPKPIDRQLLLTTLWQHLSRQS